MDKYLLYMEAFNTDGVLIITHKLPKLGKVSREELIVNKDKREHTQELRMDEYLSLIFLYFILAVPVGHEFLQSSNFCNNVSGARGHCLEGLP